LHDVTFPLYLEVDEIYHLACPASPIHYQKDPVQTTKTCVMGTINMLGLAKRTKAKMLQASTSEVYGDPKIHPQSEDYWGHVNPIGIRACYDEGKRCAETLCMDYQRQYNVDVNIVRIFNTYGPNMAKDDGRVVSNFINQALENENITIYGDGSQTRSFCYVKDMVRGIKQVMQGSISYYQNQDKIKLPINIGNPREFTINKLANKVLDLTESKSKIIYKDLPSDDPKQRKPNIELLQSMYKWKPYYTLEDGLHNTIKYFTYGS
jgi:UDP-glucuronate decarboxylase